MPIPIKCYRMKDPVANTSLVLDYIERATGITIAFQEGHRARFIRDMVKDILAIDPGYVYTGCNNILTGILPTNDVNGVYFPIRGKPFNEFHLRPFMSMHKGEILSLFREHDVLDMLPLTHSCGVTPYGTPECGACYFCLEKAWGLTQAGLAL